MHNAQGQAPEGIPLLADNYAWLLVRGSDAAVVDPSEAGPVLELLRGRGLTLRTVLATHHHGDHVGGIEELAEAFPGLEVICSEPDRERVPKATRAVRNGDRIEVLGHPVRCLLVPGHTRGALAYHLPTADAVFTGDTLFTGGCGRLFEGTPAQMLQSLERLASLPGSPGVYCGHEYTEKNLAFALSLTPEDRAVAGRLAQVRSERAAGRPTVPAPLALERRTNPFLRCHDPALQAVTGRTDPAEVFADLRRRKDAF